MRLDKNNQSITFTYRAHLYLAPFVGLAIFCLMTLVLTGVLFAGLTLLFGLEEKHPWLFIIGLWIVIAICLYLLAKLFFYADKLVTWIFARVDTVSFYEDYFVSERYGKVHCRDVVRYEFRQDNLVSNNRIVIYCVDRVLHYALDFRTNHKTPESISDVMLMTWIDEEEKNFLAFRILLQRFEKLFIDWNGRAYQSQGREKHFIYKGDFFRRPLPIIMGVLTSVALLAGTVTAFFVFKYKLPVLGTLPIVIYMTYKLNSYLWQNIIAAWKRPR